MTTTLTIHLPITPGAKTCEGCMHCCEQLDYCGQFRKSRRVPAPLTRADGVLQRLPECLAAEMGGVRRVVKGAGSDPSEWPEDLRIRELGWRHD